MVDPIQQTEPQPTSYRGTVANWLSPVDQSSAFNIVTITPIGVGMPGESITWDLLSDQKPSITIANDVKFELPINIERVPGEIFFIEILQDSVGAHKAFWGSAFDWDASGEPILAQGPGTRTILEFYCTGDHLLGKVFYKTPEDDQTVMALPYSSNN